MRKREDYRIVTNGRTFKIQGRYRLLFWHYWRDISDADSNRQHLEAVLDMALKELEASEGPWEPVK